MIQTNDPLTMLRVMPDQAVKKYCYIVEVKATEPKQAQDQAWKCNVTYTLEMAGTRAMVKLLVEKNDNGTDWYYPYIQEGLNIINYARIPVGQPPGTLVLTTGMNGCALQVNKENDEYIFIHDANGKTIEKMKNVAPVPGDTQLRIEYKDYAGTPPVGQLMSEALRKDNQLGTYQYTLLTVKRQDNLWEVYVSGGIDKIVSYDGHKKYSPQCFDQNVGELKGLIKGLIEV